MKSFTKSNINKQIHVCKRGAEVNAIDKIKKNTDTFILTYGQFSLIDALMEILEQTGPAHVAISTWTAAHAHLDRTAELMNGADILSFKMIVDRSFRSRQPAFYDHMIQLFGQDSIREIRTHAKFMTIRNDKWDIVCRTSMNLNENPRLENIEVSENKEFADFFEKIVVEIFSEVKAQEMRSKMLKMKTMAEMPLFNLVKADYIPRKNLKEASYTHEIGD